MAATGASCWSAEVADVAGVASTSIVLRIRLNTQDKGDLFVERTPQGDFLLKLEDLRAMGFKDPRGTPVAVGGEPFISLRSMEGVSFEFQEPSLALHITADPHLLLSQSFGLEGQRRRGRGAVPTGTSAFVNYSLTVSGGDASANTIGFAGEVGVRRGDYLLLSDGTTVQDGNGRRKPIRLMSSVTHDDREDLRRTVFGDFFTPSRDFSTGVALGGVSVSKLYSLNPYFIQFPMQSVGGTVALPTDLEVYLDGQRVRTEKLRPGDFQIRDILAYGGARDVQLLLRDSFGRVQQLSYSFYFSDQPLRQGLHEFSYNAGAMRRGYGVESNRYGPPALSMFHRYGISDTMTLGVRGEATKQLFNAGPLGTMVLGSAGVVSFAWAGSSIAGHRGASGLASYNFQSKNWSMGASLRRDAGEYASLGDPPTVTNRKAEGNLFGSYYLGQKGSLSLSYSFLSVRGRVTSSPATQARPFNVTALDPRRIVTLSYAVPMISGRASLSANLSHVKDAGGSSHNEAFVGLIVFLDKGYSVAANRRSDKTSHTESLQLTKNQPIGEGLGFLVAADRTGDVGGESLRLKSSVQYNAPAAILRADLGRSTDQSGRNLNDYRVSLAGGAGYVDGATAIGRPITDSFGIVRVGGLAGVGVAVNGQSMGKTNAEGTVFVPTLTPYFDNEISISPETIPIQYSFETARKTLSPSGRSGALVDFKLTKVQAISGRLKYPHQGEARPVEFKEITITAAGRHDALQTGRGGEFYIENLKAGTYPATVEVDGRPCLFDLTIPNSDETFVELGNITCRFASY